jgi:hypothetical protein
MDSHGRAISRIQQQGETGNLFFDFLEIFEPKHELKSPKRSTTITVIVFHSHQPHHQRLSQKNHGFHHIQKPLKSFASVSSKQKLRNFSPKTHLLSSSSLQTCGEWHCLNGLLSFGKVNNTAKAMGLRI